ncbi:unnamed protein product [Schistosoma curassoni]|uniref:Phosphatidylserine synthase n=1 Tax=Schistosoma curassoni TaxID=6186 RepID=A0A183KJG5_9TREM|nr:unnamed protein product [Schistosoma curassoni]
MKTSTSGGKHGIQCMSRMQLDDLDFADDLALLSQSQQQMQEETTSVAAVSTAVGLNIHKEKSKILRYNTACTNPITIDGEDTGDVKTFSYLGSIIDEHGGFDADLKARIGKSVDDARQWLRYLDSELGKPLEEKDYGGNCRIYDWDKPDNPWHNVIVSI